MADPVVFKNGYFGMSTSVAGSNTHFGNIKEVTLPFSFEELDDAVMGDNAKSMFPGVQTGDAISVRLKQDFTSGSVDSKLWAIANGRKPVFVKTRAVNGAVSISNPSYLAKCYITSYPPIAGSHGQALETTITLRIASGSSITRSTST